MDNMNPIYCIRTLYPMNAMSYSVSSNDAWLEDMSGQNKRRGDRNVVSDCVTDNENCIWPK